MLAMQYSLRLPRDHDIDWVNQRVERRTRLFQGFEGLLHKSYLYSPEESVYAPLYIWSNTEAARRFLFNGLFDSAVESFGRPRVRTWSVLNFGYGNRDNTVGYAFCAFDKVTSDDQLAEVEGRELARHSDRLQRPGLYAHWVGIDTDRWEVARFSLWRDKESAVPPDADCVYGYKVLHVDEPHSLSA
ncbi:DUF4865 family protein [Oceanibacterium hippocampi]|uniref:DUF4865 domain-containing protein n=1 Tax=Oceanibacterium hippocampi TaxID=745714 RepID=A0A1Y5SRM0_9PROT|nr:DUF4865 family protein [Oceanibacterium hippocampi]SLN44973.1 hypothetical protein OCH7691_01918 [Oceanibacterium hippocampi]